MEPMQPALSAPADTGPRPGGRIPHASLTTMPLVLAWLATRPSFCIVQIGANRGDTPEDPLFRFLSTELPAMTPERRARTLVVLVEPAAEDFKRLRQAYAGVPCVRFENVAVAETRGVRELNRLGVDPVAHGYPSWMSGLASLRAERMTTLWDEYEKEHGPADRDIKGFYERWRAVEPVTCVTFADLLQRHGIKAIDLLQIDTEGYDYRILQTIDFNRIRPAFVNYERVLLQEDEAACRQLMTRAGYSLTDRGPDTLCTRRC